MRIDPARSALIAVHLQERLLPALEDADSLLARAAWLAGAARRIGVPMLALELNPARLGPTVDALAGLVGTKAVAEGMRFDCTDTMLDDLPGGERPQRILVGAEVHVCVLQAAFAMRDAGKDVFVVADAVGARRAADRDAALARLRANGIEIVTREMVVFEWLGRAGTPLFRDVLRDFLREEARPR